MTGQILHFRSGETDKDQISSVGSGMKNTEHAPLISVPDDRMEIIGEETKREAESQDASIIIEDDSGIRKPMAKLSPAQLLELANLPKTLPMSIHIDGFQDNDPRLVEQSRKRDHWSTSEHPDQNTIQTAVEMNHVRKRSGSALVSPSEREKDVRYTASADLPTREYSLDSRPLLASRTLSTPPMKRKSSNNKTSGQISGSNTQAKSAKSVPAPLDFDVKASGQKPLRTDDGTASPMPSSIPLPPLSLPTYIHLELSSERPSPLYIHHSITSDFPYESSQVKIERLLNFLLLPPQLEQVLWFGALACLDAWLYSFTILPLRFLNAIHILYLSWSQNLAREAQFIGAFLYVGIGRVWRRSRGRLEVISEPPTSSTTTTSRSANTSTPTSTLHPTLSPLQTEFPSSTENQSMTALSHPEPSRKRNSNAGHKHRRTKSAPSTLLPDHKADILTGLLILFSCVILMYFDASMMYHSIRGQAAIKLYVIYNVLEVCWHL